VPFSDAGRGVSLISEVIGNGEFIWMQSVCIAGENNVFVHANTLGVATRKKSFNNTVN
jgi:hypothetical protein